jgi:hypothetical protein
LAGVLKAAEELQVSGLFAASKNVKAIDTNSSRRMSKAKPTTTGDTVLMDTMDASKPSYVPPPVTTRPSSGGSNSSGSQKTGSSRKKNPMPKKLIVHSNGDGNTPPESQSPSPESYYTPSNGSHEGGDNRRPTPSSSRCSNEENGDTPMDFSKSGPSRDDDSNEEKPLVINEADEHHEAKRALPFKKLRHDSVPTLPQNPVPPANANQLLQNMHAMRQNMPWGSNPFTMMQAAAALSDPNRTSSESSLVDHDSEREEPHRLMPRLPHPTLPGMNPQDMIQKLQQFMNNGGVNPATTASRFPPWAPVTTSAMTQALMAQVTGSMNGLPITSSPGMTLPPTLASNMLPSHPLSNSPPNDVHTPTTPSSTRGGIPVGIGPSGKPAVACEICGKTLADPSSLYRHRKIHNGDKPHQCPFCGRKFIQRYNMTQHIKTHLKPRGINSLVNSPAGVANLLSNHRADLSQMQIPEEMINSLMNGQQEFEPRDQDTNPYEGENNTPERNQHQRQQDHHQQDQHQQQHQHQQENTKEEMHEDHIDPC